jgi:NADH-quinone oxidoreductase subunit C
MIVQDFHLFLMNHVPNGLLKSCHLSNDIYIGYCDKGDLKELVAFLRDDNDCAFTMLTDICGADFPERIQRFEVVYNLLSLKKNIRILIKVLLEEDESVPSISEVFNASVWYEREVWDMYGVVFEDSPDLRRILTDYGFEGHPLRKDFPLSGYKEVIYDNVQQKVIYQPVTLPQEFRNFDFLSPWEGTDYVLPGDEKVEKNLK